MPAYMTVALRYSDPSWTEGYRREVPPMLERVGARYLAKQLHPQRIEGEGEPWDLLAIVEFPDAKIAREFMASAEYRPWAEARQAGAESEIHIVEA